jgi:RNA methyltransferase, TrmH family
VFNTGLKTGLKTISSRDNALYKRLLRLASSSRERRKSGKTVLDGMHLIAAYCEHCGDPDTVVISPAGREELEISAFLAQRPSIDPVLFSAPLFDDIAQVAHPTGIVAICDVPEARLPERPPERCVLLEGVQDPGNLGSILRSAAAAGVTHMFLSPDCAFAWSPKTLRAGMGAHFALSIHERAELAETASWFGGDIVAALPRARETIYRTDLSGRVAWLFGSEGEGLSAAALALATRTASIPMAKSSESLNVAAAAAICLFEQQRQRAAKPSKA